MVWRVAAGYHQAMQYDVDTPQAYLDALDEDWRKALVLQLREIISDVAPDWSEGIGHKMLSYSGKTGPAMHLNAQKGYVALYVGDALALDPDGSLLAGLDCGKSCIRLRKTKVPARPDLIEILRRVAARYDLNGHNPC